MNDPVEAMTSAPSRAEPAGRLDVRHLVFGSWDPVRSSIHKVAHQLAAEQRAAGDSARIVALTDKRERGPRDGAAVEQLSAGGPRWSGAPVWIGRDIADRVLAGSTAGTIVHLHGGRKPGLVPLSWLLRRRRVPYVLTPHGSYGHLFHERRSIRRRLVLRCLMLFEQKVLTGARFVQALSAEERDIIKKLAPRAAVGVVGNGAFSTRDNATPAAIMARHAPVPPVFGFCSRLAIEHKGIDLLIDGFAMFRVEGGTAALELIGSGAGEIRVRALLRQHGLDQTARLLGAKFDREKDEAMAGWGWFVLTSRFEGLPLAALEAAFSGLPLIVSHGTGLAERVRGYGAGIVVDSPTPGAVAAALRSAAAASDSDWSAMSAQAQLMARETADWVQIAASLRRLYCSP